MTQLPPSAYIVFFNVVLNGNIIASGDEVFYVNPESMTHANIANTMKIVRTNLKNGTAQYSDAFGVQPSEFLICINSYHRLEDQ